MRLLFLGSGEFGLPTLESLARKHELLAVVSQPDKPAGRKRVLTPTPIAQWALDHNVKLFRHENINTPQAISEIAALQPDAAIVIAFGQKLSPPLIDALGRLAVNLHSSLLPRFRGAAPINAAILAGDHETGACVISLAQKMDAGLIYARASTPIKSEETAGELHDRLAQLGPALIDQVLADFLNGTLKGETQDETQATRAPKLSKDDSWIDVNAAADAIRCRVHGLTPWPGVRVWWRKKGATSSADFELLLRRVKVESTERAAQAKPGTFLDSERIAVGHGGVLRLLEVQVPGSRVMTMREFLNGRKIEAGDELIGRAETTA